MVEAGEATPDVTMVKRAAARLSGAAKARAGAVVAGVLTGLMFAGAGVRRTAMVTGAVAHPNAMVASVRSVRLGRWKTMHGTAVGPEGPWMMPPSWSFSLLIRLLTRLGRVWLGILCMMRRAFSLWERLLWKRVLFLLWTQN
jgi:hypothetical protein